MSFELKQHQIAALEEAYRVISQYKLCYIFGQPRVGKSLIALALAKKYFHNLGQQAKIIVFTKKNAIKDWEKYQKDYNFHITNYEKVDKLDKSYYNLIIIDEAHNFGSFPKFSERVKKFKDFCRFKPIIYLSGTPFIESPLKAYSQFALSSYSPFKFITTGRRFFEIYGIPHKIRIGNGQIIETYSKAKTDEIMKEINPYIVRVTYEDAGFVYQNEDEVVYLNTPDEYIKIEKTALKNHLALDLTYNTTPLETVSAEAQFLHRLSGGFYNNRPFPKVKFLWLKKFIQENPNKKIAIMCYFIEEQDYISNYFSKNELITVLSSTKYCEGVDLSHFDHYILYSFGYSGSKFVQLRDRIVHLDKNYKTKVIIPLLNKGLDKIVYDVVSQKKSFNSKTLYDYFDRLENRL